MEEIYDYKNQGKSSGKREQYGKKGWKPRNSNRARSTVDLDKVTTNKIDYWNKTEAFNNVTKFTWPLIIGEELDFGALLNDGCDSGRDPYQIMRINFVPGPGYTNGEVHDGVNDALARMMTKIRASLSTSNIGFETADLGIFNASLASTAALIGVAKRAFGIFHNWNGRNLTLPRAILKTMGLEYDDMRANFNAYAGALKSVIEEYNALELLDIFDVYDRQYTMCHNIFADEDSAFAQHSYFMPVGYYRYNEGGDAPYAEFVQLSISSFQDILDAIYDSIDSWKRSSDFYTINGPLHRAFKDAPIQHIPMLDEMEAITPVVDRVFTMQIMNLTIMGHPQYDTYDITQNLPDQDSLIWQPRTGELTDLTNPHYVPTLYGYQTGTKRLLRLFEDEPTADDNMELTRLMCRGTLIENEGNFEIDCVGAGTEFVTTIMVYTYDGPLNLLGGVEITTHIWRNVNEGEGYPAYNAEQLVGAISPFRYIPAFFMESWNSGIPEFRGIVGDLYNYMVYDVNDFDKLQFQALRSIWKPKNI